MFYLWFYAANLHKKTSPRAISRKIFSFQASAKIQSYGSEAFNQQKRCIRGNDASFLLVGELSGEREVSGGGLFGGVRGHVVEALGAERHLGAVAGNHCRAEFGLGDMADYFHAFDFADGVMLVERNGE